MKKSASYGFVWTAYFLLGFPLFYFVYKFGNPNFGCNDFFSYYKLYSAWDIDNVDAPFNMRLLSSFFVYLFNKAGLHYDTETAFDQFGLDRDVYFSAVLFNFLCITTSCTVIFYTIYRQFKNFLLSCLGGAIYLLGFGTIFYEFMPITDALSVLMFAVVFNQYLVHDYKIILSLILLIFQREYIFLALGLIALLDFIKKQHKYYLHVIIVSVCAFAAYYVLRKTLFYTPRYDHQASTDFFLDSIVNLKFPLLPYIKQTIMTLNIFILYVLVLVAKKTKGLPIAKFEFIKILLLFLQINVISVAAVFGNNTGRYFYILVPMVIFQLINESKELAISK